MARNRYFEGEARPVTVRDPITEMLNNPGALSSFMHSEWDPVSGTMTYKANNYNNTTSPRWNSATNSFQWGYGRGSVGGGFSGGGAPGGGTSASAPAPQYGGLQPQAIQPIGGASGSSQGLAGLSAPTAGATPGFTLTGVPAAGGTVAPASSGGWLANAAKWAGSNQRLLTGLVTTLGSAYGQYQEKSAAKDAWKYQKGELDRQRAYEQQRVDAYRNSPAAKMSGEFMRLVLNYYDAKLKKRGVSMDLTRLLGTIPE